MPLNEAETRYHLIDPALRGRGYRMPWIKLEAEASALDRAARQSKAKAKAAAIEAAVYDLKAVNPNAVVKNDTRTPEEVIQSMKTMEGSLRGRWRLCEECCSTFEPLFA